MSYSQHDEERVIVDYFDGRIGAFLDVGAFDGKTFSNTLRLAESGFSGLAIEPDPFACGGLINTYRDRGISGVKILNAAILPEAGIVKFSSSCGDGVSTVDKLHRDTWKASGTTYRDIFVCAVTVKDVLEKFPGPYHLVNLDVESVNLAALRRLPLREMGTSLICVEHDGLENEVRRYCMDAGLTKELLRNDENIIFGE